MKLTRNQMIHELAERDALCVSLAESMEIVLKFFMLRYAELDTDVLDVMWCDYFGSETNNKEDYH